MSPPTTPELPTTNERLHMVEKPSEEDAAPESFEKGQDTNGSTEQGTYEQATTEYLQPSVRSTIVPKQLINGDDDQYLGFDLDADGEDLLDIDFASQIIGEYPGDDSQLDIVSDLRDKRKNAEDGDQDDEGGGKRREGGTGSAKKPGRKPAAAEPTTVSHFSSLRCLADDAQKRKAQNRAAQRAFRDRKEKHLKDLETKIDDLEKASETANSENTLLRAHVGQLQDELQQYRKRMSLIGKIGGTGSPPRGSGVSGAATRNSFVSSASDFQFEFPQFGDVAADQIPQPSNTGKPESASVSNSSHAQANEALVQASNYAIPGIISRGLPSAFPLDPPTLSPVGPSLQDIRIEKSNGRFDRVGGPFSPSILEDDFQVSPSYISQATSHPLSQPRSTQPTQKMQSQNVRQQSNSSSANTASPESSHDSQHNISSICTSPDLPSSSPGQKVGLSAIYEENQAPATLGGFPSNPVLDPNSFNWLVQQNGGSFDPILFGDYRDPQETLASGDFGAYIKDAFPLPEMGSPEHYYQEAAPSHAKPKVMAQVEEAQSGADNVFADPRSSETMPCKQMWDELQSTEKFRNGEIDIDNLCNQMKLKARCSEGGPVVSRKDFEKVVGPSG